MLSLFDICKVSLLGTLQNIAGWDGMTEITSEGQFEMLELSKVMYLVSVCPSEIILYTVVRDCKKLVIINNNDYLTSCLAWIK